MHPHYELVLFLYVKWVRDVEAGGSNPLTPTRNHQLNQELIEPRVSGLFCFLSVCGYSVASITHHLRVLSAFETNREVMSTIWIMRS